MPKLQKHKTRKKGGENYTKWMLSFPANAIETAKFKKGEWVQVIAKEGKITIIRDKKKQKEKKKGK